MPDGPDQPAGAVPGAPPAPPGAFEPLRSRPFREVWLGNSASSIGSQIQSVAAAWLMTDLTTRHVLVAAVPAANPMAMLLLSVFAGVLADNFDRRMLMLIGQWFMLVASAVLAVLTYAGWIGPWSLLAFTLMIGAGTALVLPSWSASVRALLGDSRTLPQAIGLNSISANLARSVGPAIGGIVLATAGVAAAFAINAVSYIALIVALMRWKPAAEPLRREPLLRSVRAGIAFSWRSGPVRRVLVRCSAYGFGAIGVLALLPVILRGALHGSETDYGLLLGTFGTGAVFGAFGATEVRRRFGAEVAVVVGTGCSILGLIGLGIAPSVLTLAPFLFFGGIGWTACLNALNIAIQVRAPVEILGRTMAIYQAVTLGSAAIGAWAWGSLADTLDGRASVLWAAAWLAASTVVLLFFSPLPARGEGVVLERG